MGIDLNLQSIFLLLLFVAPGFLFTRTYRAYRPRYYRQSDAFEQIVLSIVGSLLVHALLSAGTGIILFISWQMGGTFNPFAISTAGLATYPPGVVLAFGFGVLGYLSLSLVIARRFGNFLGNSRPTERPRWWRVILGQDFPEPIPLWHTLLVVEPLRLNLIPLQLSVQLRNGEYFEGYLKSVRLVGDEENTIELALSNVRHRADPDSTLEPRPNQVILLKSPDILWLSRNDLPR